MSLSLSRLLVTDETQFFERKERANKADMTIICLNYFDGDDNGAGHDCEMTTVIRFVILVS